MKKPLQTLAKKSLQLLASPLKLVLKAKDHPPALDSKKSPVIETAMNPLQTLAHPLGLVLKTEYYLPHLDAEESALIESALHQKSQHYHWNLLRLLALKILTTLKSWPLLSSEVRFKCYSARLEADLLSSDEDLPRLRSALEHADTLFEVACRRRAASPESAVSAAASGHLWSASQDRQYESVRRTYLAHNDTLTALHEHLERLKDQWRRLSGPRTAQQPPEWKTVPQEIPAEFLAYQSSACQLRLSDQNILRLMSTTGDKRAIYRELTAPLMKPPTPEKISDNVQSAKIFLHYKAESIMHNAKELSRCMVEDIQQAIEHRVRVKLAYANQLEQLSITLGHLIQLLHSYRIPNSPQSELKELAHSASPLSRWLTEAKTLQTTLEQSPFTFRAAALEEKLPTWDTYRKQFAQSIPTGWMNFFSANRRAREQQEKQLNAKLQSALAALSRPLRGFDDHANLMPPEQIHKQIQQRYAVVDQLDKQQKEALLEREKMEKIRNTFAR